MFSFVPTYTYVAFLSNYYSIFFVGPVRQFKKYSTVIKEKENLDKQ